MTQALSEPRVATRGELPKAPQKAEPRRAAVFGHALAFVAGFTIVFTLLGSAAGLLGQSLNRYIPTIQQIGAILLVIFALVTLGVFRWASRQVSERADLETNPAAAALVSVLNFFNGLLYTERRVGMHNVSGRWGYLSSALMGVTFSAGWTPCIGPILSSILFLSTNSSTPGQGAILLAVYSVGLGVPFLLVGAAFGRATGLLRRLNRHMGLVSIVSGIFLLYVAYLLWTNQLAMLNARLYFLNYWVEALDDGALALFGMNDVIDASLLAAAPLAFAAGLISFISPCVLPLIPAYIGYLSGATVGRSASV